MGTFKQFLKVAKKTLIGSGLEPKTSGNLTSALPCKLSSSLDGGGSKQSTIICQVGGASQNYY